MAMRRLSILIVNEDTVLRSSLVVHLGSEHTVSVAESCGEGLQRIKGVGGGGVDLVLLDSECSGKSGLESLKKIMAEDSPPGVIMMVDEGRPQDAVEALKLGAFDYISKPFGPGNMTYIIKRFADTLSSERSLADVVTEGRGIFGSLQIISDSPSMVPIFDDIHKLGDTTTTILVTGESGTGKELIARAVHASGARRRGRFVPINCGSIPRELLESELFGHERGSFTGAVGRKEGSFKYADGGTIFLDEVSSMDKHLQVKLLRFLQERTFKPVGSNSEVKVDVRVVAATNIPLERCVEEGNFREDLYYRLNVIPLEIPALRDRKEDIPILAGHFIKLYSERYSKTGISISPAAMSTLCSYRWPGNIRELENLVERMVVLGTDGMVIQPRDLPEGILFKGDGGLQEFTDEGTDLRGACKAFEKSYIVGVLNRLGWSRAKTSKALKVHRNTLLAKMKILGIKEPYNLRTSSRH